MQLIRTVEEIAVLEQKIKTIYKERGDLKRGSVIIEQARMDVDYQIGPSDSSNHQLWNYHYYEALKNKIS